jgi:hypothetical protein
MHTQLIPSCNISKWYSEIFEFYGWLMLAKRDNVIYRIENYKNEILDCINSIKERIEVTESQDRILDLKIMLSNLDYLYSLLENKNNNAGKIIRGGRFGVHF